MADRLETPTAPEAEKSSAGANSSAPAGGIKSWLPLIVTVVAMPILAFAMTKFFLVPQVMHSLSASGVKVSAGSESGGKGGKAGAADNVKITVPMNKMLVNISGTMGTRYLMASITLVGKDPDFKNKIEDNKDQLLDLATGTLSSKTISDLEKPGIRNVIRSELISVFNTALGGPLVQEIYITELAIQ
jgi:flagellar FliL protein